MRTYAALALAAAAAAPAAGAPLATHSGFYGDVTRGPLLPVCRDSVPCYGPARHARIDFVRAGRVVARVRTNGEGSYRVALPTGRYAVRVSPRLGRAVDPHSVRVVRGLVTRRDLSIDTGIR